MGGLKVEEKGSNRLISTTLFLLAPKAFSVVCKSFHNIESKHRKKLKLLRQEHLSTILARYPNIAHLDLTLCPRVNDNSLATISSVCNSTLRSIDLLRSEAFSGSGLLSLSMNCKNLVEIDVSNAIGLKDAGAAALAKAKNLEKLWMGRCKLVTDMGVGCIAVGCKKLRLINLKWCLGVGDLGAGLMTVKCKEIRSLDLSYLPRTTASKMGQGSSSHVGNSSQVGTVANQ